MTKSHKLPSFEGLRGIAAIMVVFWHLHWTFYAKLSADLDSHLAWLPHNFARLIVQFAEGLYNGNFAVWLFWTMSAFVLSIQFFLRANQTDGPQSHDYLEDACLRRYPRLFVPVAASVVIAYVIDALGWMHNVRLADLLGEPYKSGWLSNWYNFVPSFGGAVKSATWQSFFRFDLQSSYNAVLWTMVPELWGSFFLFAFLGLLGHRRSRYVAYPVFLLIFHRLGLDWLNAFVGGILLCDIYVNRDKLRLAKHGTNSKLANTVSNNSFLAVIAWAMIILFAGAPNYHNVLYFLLSLAAVVVTLSSRTTQRVLSSKVLVFLGTISFGVYLIHLPLICSLTCWAYLRTVGVLGAGTAAVLLSTLTLVLSIALGYAFYVFVDRPSLAFSRWVSSFIMNSGWKASKKSQPYSGPATSGGRTILALPESESHHGEN